MRKIIFLQVVFAIFLGILVYAFIALDGIIWLAKINNWLAQNLIENLGYWGVFILMSIESSFVPFPSEIVMPPAGSLARTNPDWTLEGVILAGTLGSLAGAFINYYLAYLLGRNKLLMLVKRFGKYFFITEATYLKGEDYFKRHGVIIVFLARLLPSIRQVISLPAGLVRMNLLVFSLVTSLGAGIWCAILAFVGYTIEGSNINDILKEYTVYIIITVVSLGVIYASAIIYRRRRNG